jgi:hypothetical protein
VAAFLMRGLQIASQEPTTLLWFALGLRPSSFVRDLCQKAPSLHTFEALYANGSTHWRSPRSAGLLHDWAPNSNLRTAASLNSFVTVLRDRLMTLCPFDER